MIHRFEAEYIFDHMIPGFKLTMSSLLLLISQNQSHKYHRSNENLDSSLGKEIVCVCIYTQVCIHRAYTQKCNYEVLCT